MAYSRVNWQDSPSTATPRNAANLNKMDLGIATADTNASSALTNAATAQTTADNAISYLNSSWVLETHTWTFSSVDNPTGVLTINADVRGIIGLGDRIKFTNGGNTIYGIITKISYSAPNTTITFLHEINPANNQALYLMANSAITNTYFSHSKAPLGFPMNSNKWSVVLTDTSVVAQGSPVASTYYNLGSLNITIPIGLWKLSYEAVLFIEKLAAAGLSFTTCLSESSNSLVGKVVPLMAEGDTLKNLTIYGKNYIDAYEVTSKKTLYVIGYTLLTGTNRFLLYGTQVPTVIRAVCTYL